MGSARLLLASASADAAERRGAMYAEACAKMPHKIGFVFESGIALQGMSERGHYKRDPFKFLERLVPILRF